MLLHLIADYGPNDPAFVEVAQRLYQHLPNAHVQYLSVPPFSTLATGFWIAQLGLNDGPTSRCIYHNCAPRHDNPDARMDNEGEGLTFAELCNGVKVVGVWAGYTLSFIKEFATSIHSVDVSRAGSQFRSRDVFPKTAASLLNGDRYSLGTPIPASQVPDIPTNRVAWIDGYGNLKTTIPASSVPLTPSTPVTVRVGDVVSNAVFSDGSFEVPEGTLAFAPGSSGWTIGSKSCRWIELFLRGGSAWQRFGKPRIGQNIVYSPA
ncbi:MAG: hypothetical protein AAF268_13370 [Cyanobacteria bacterium P01_A01_bin.3]